MHLPYQLYGHKRSGTNVIDAYLKDNFNLGKMSQKINPSQFDRDSILWKHCRIDLVNNNGKLLINTIEDLDNIRGDEKHSNKYIIVYKNIFTWLPSICRWASSMKWEKNEKLDFVDDYFNYMYKWYTISKDNSDRILFINYEEFLKNGRNKDSDFVKNIEEFTNFKITKELVIRDKVDCSRKFDDERHIYYDRKLYMKKYDKNEINKIKSHKYFKIIEENFF